MIPAPPTADDDPLLTLVDHPDPAVDDFHWSLRDFGGKVLRDFLSKPGVLLDTIQQEWIYRGDQLTAMVDVTEEDPQTMHFSLDHLGTTRLETDETGNVEKKWKYFPYGEDASPIAPGEPRLRFTGHERDTYSPMTNTDDLDWMHARFEAPGIGRFLGTEFETGDPASPQSWNRFTYALGNPLAYVDPDGRTAIAAEILVGAAGVYVAVVWAATPSRIDATKTNAQVMGEQFVHGFQALRGAIDTILTSSDSNEGGQDTASKEGAGTSDGKSLTEHGEERAQEARDGDTHRQVGDANRVEQQGREFVDTKTGNRVFVRGDRVVITDSKGNRLTQFKNSRRNTQQRIHSGRWVPVPK